MKFLVLLALVSVAFSAPQPKKIFHENFEDFIDLIDEHVGSEIFEIMSHYLEHEEFTATFDYMDTANFKNLIYEMEDLPEFKAVLDFLETHGIDITYFIDRFNALLDYSGKIRSSRHETSGTDFTSFIQDTVELLPKEQLADLFDQKLEEDEDFRTAIQSLSSEEWKQIFADLWENEVFLAEVQTLATNGIDVGALLDELIAIFGQN